MFQSKAQAFLIFVELTLSYLRLVYLDAKLTNFSDSPKEMLKKNNSCLIFLRERPPPSPRGESFQIVLSLKGFQTQRRKAFFIFHLLPFAPSRLVNNKLLSPFRKTNKNKRKQSKTFSVYFIGFICFNWFYSVFLDGESRFSERKFDKLKGSGFI